MKRRIKKAKPCPFCGSKDIYYLESEGWFICCRECNGQIGDERSKKKLLERWNSRDDAEIKRLQGIINAEPEIIEAIINKEGMSIDLESWAVKLLAFSLNKFLGDSKNYKFAIAEVKGANQGKIVVTVQRANHQTPEEQLSFVKTLLNKKQQKALEVFQSSQR